MALETRLADARSRVSAAKSQAAISLASAERAEHELAEIGADVERRLGAIQLVEDMLGEIDHRAAMRPYAHMTQDDAIRDALKSVNKLLNSSELADMLKHGGYAFTSTNPANSIVVAANTNRKGYFTTTREGNRTLVGLKEWLPDQLEEGPFQDSEDRTFC